MKLPLYQLESHLGLDKTGFTAPNFFPIYLLSGDEWVQKNEAVQLIRKALKKNGILERIRITPEPALTESFYTALYSRSLLEKKRLLEIDFRNHLPNKTTADILQEYAQNPLEDQVILIDLPKMETKIAKSSWISALEKTGCLITIWPISRTDLPKWIRERAQKYKLKMTPEAVNLLADCTEGNLAAALSTLEKIYLLQPQNSVDRELVLTVITDETRFTLFDLTDHLIAFDTERSLRILENLKKEGILPALILWAILRELRLLVLLSQELKQGITFDTLCQKHRIFSHRKPLIRRFLATLSRDACWRLFKDALEIDKAIKGISTVNVWNSLQIFCLRITEVQSKQ